MCVCVDLSNIKMRREITLILLTHRLDKQVRQLSTNLDTGINRYLDRAKISVIKKQKQNPNN